MIDRLAPKGLLGRRRTLFGRLVLSLGAILLLAFAVAAGLSMHTGSRFLEERATRDLRAATAALAQALGENLEQRQSDVSLWASLPAMLDVRTGDVEGRIQGLLLRLQSAYDPIYAQLVVTARDGTITAATRRESVGQILDLQGYGLHPVRGGELQQSGLLGLPDAAGNALILAHPIRASDSEQPVGWLAVWIDWRHFEEHVAALSIEGQAQDAQGFVLLVDPNGEVLAGRSDLMPQATLPASTLAPAMAAGIVRTPLAASGDYFAAWSSVPTGADDLSAWRVIAFRHTRAALAVVRVFAWSVAGSALLGLLLAAGASLQIAREVTRQIRRLADGALTLAGGDLAHRVSEAGDAEIVQLAGAFNRMAAELARSRDGLEQAVADRTRELEERSLQLAQALVEARRTEERNRKLARAVDAAAEAVILTDPAGTVTEVNPAFERLTGWPANKAVGRNPRILKSGRNPPELYAEMWGTLVRGEVWSGRLVNRRRDGSLYHAALTISPITDGQGSLLGYVGLERDVTQDMEREAALAAALEQSRAAAVAKSQFLANMSHEIRTPLNGVIGMTELALDTRLDDEQREYLTIVQSSADALLTVINDILDFSKIEAGKLDLDPRPFDLQDCLCETMRMLALRAHEKGLELSFHVQQDVPELLVGDRDRLRQILVNLVSNAIKFTERGEVTVRVHLESAAGDGVELHFAVTDTGIGIPAEKQQHIFEAFSQADNSITRRFGGTGLGLSISARLVELMQGRIWVESDMGRGSTFRFTARFALAPPGEPGTTGHGGRQLAGLAALVVDDNATNRRIVGEMLRCWGMRATLADGVESALAAIAAARTRGEPFAVVLSDVHMPGASGFDLMDELRRAPDAAEAAVLMLTSGEIPEHRERCRQLGVAATLLKPFKQAELLAAILEARAAGAPVGAQARSTPTSAPRASCTETAPTRPLRALLVDDQPVNRKLARLLLEKRGCTVTVAATGREALARLDGAVFDIVFVEIEMPEMDGFQATAAIRAREREAGGHLAIIGMTASVEPEERARCLAAGMDGCLAKPIRAEDLDAALGAAAPRDRPETGGGGTAGTS
jgi:PAS domain S-box-containing protein